MRQKCLDSRNIFLMMLESKKELVVLESSLSSASTKRSPFHLLSSIFSKKKQTVLENESFDKSKQRGTYSNGITSKNSSSGDESFPRPSTIVPGTLEDAKAFRSPIAKTRRENLKIDLETLHLSRQDNPYLKQLERFSLPEETLMSCALAENALLQEDVYINATEKDVDIHQHLVRSPPPQFPQNLSHFMYIQANSPKRQINQTKTENGENEGHEGSKKSKTLNPVLPKRESGTLDPGIREVLEYQKSQLRAGLQHSLNTNQGKFGTAPTHYVPVEQNCNFDSKSILIVDSGSRFRPSKPVESVSLPNYLDLEQASKKLPLGPLRIGRTLSDSICLDNNFRNNELKQ